eukprot:8803480-Pyramimonas_sp.AAC.1
MCASEPDTSGDERTRGSDRLQGLRRDPVQVHLCEAAGPAAQPLHQVARALPAVGGDGARSTT